MMKVMIVKEVMTGDVLPVAIFLSDPGIPGPIYGSGSLSLTEYERFCRLN